MNDNTVESFRLEVSRYVHHTGYSNETRARSTFTDILRTRRSIAENKISPIVQENSWTPNTFLHRLILNHDFFQHTFQGTIMRALLGDTFSSRIGIDTDLNEVLIGIAKAFNKEISDHCGAVHKRLEILGMIGNKNPDGSIFLGNITNNTVENRINPLINSMRKLIEMYENKGQFPFINIRIDVDQSFVDLALQDPDIAYHIGQLHRKFDKYLPPTQERLLSSAIEDLAYSDFEAEDLLKDLACRIRDAEDSNDFYFDKIPAELTYELQNLINLAKKEGNNIESINRLSDSIKLKTLQINQLITN